MQQDPTTFATSPMASPSLTPLRVLLRTPATLRPLLLQQQQQQPSLRASYYSHEHPIDPPYRSPESQILSSALTHVPTHGFTQASLTLGAKDANYLDISTNLFPRGPFELVRYHLITQRLALRHSPSASLSSSQEAPLTPLHVRVRQLILARLHANASTGILPHWSQALGIMSLAENIPASLRELGALSDEIWYLAGDKAVDGSWYSKRAALASVYAATEIFQTTDKSEGFRETEEFLDRRLEEVRQLGGAVGGTMEWLGFQGQALVGLMRSKGVRI